jgi:hypothetical protein
MRLKLNGEEWEVYFRYTSRWQHFRKKCCGQITKSYNLTDTECILENLTQGKIRYTGLALQNPNDRFVKDTGRKLAMKRALSSFTGQFRSAFWNHYHTAKQARSQQDSYASRRVNEG